MRQAKILFYSCLLVLTQNAIAQQATCVDPQVKSQVIMPTPGQANGEIKLQVQTSDKYTVFLTNRHPQQAKEPIKDDKVVGLPAGFYDFLIISERGCFSQLTVTLK
jgi:hypothetical protein